MKKTLLFMIVLLTALSACAPARQAATQTTRSTPPDIQPTPQDTPRLLATPYSDQPAAGICASPEGALVTITIYPDIPDPRCAIVRPDQRLQVVNSTQADLQVSLGDFTATLAPGVHQVQVLPCCGPELWLQTGSP